MPKKIHKWNGREIPVKPLPAHLTGTVIRQPGGVVWRLENTKDFAFSPKK